MLRPLYEKYGVESYYKRYASEYQNPHLPQIRALLGRNAERMNTELLLDFCCGGGEVSAFFAERGCTNLSGSDPYTLELYRSRLPQAACFDWDFKAVVRGEMTGTYTCIVCSFALHLCPEEQLFSVAWELLQRAPLLVVLTPHKRPALEQFEAFRLLWSDAEPTEKGKSVFCKAYGLSTTNP